MKREFLKELGLADEAIDKIMAENGKDIETHKAAAAGKETELATANQTIQQLQEAVKKFDGVDVSALNKQIADLQTKYDTDIAAAKLGGALEAALLGAKSKNTKAVRALLNMDEVKLDGDKLLGLDAQLEKLKTDAAYLFEDAAPNKPGVKMDSGLPHGNPVSPSPQSLREAIAERMNKGE